jgi:hypothetical protein
MIPFEFFMLLPFISRSCWKNRFGRQNGRDPRNADARKRIVGQTVDIESNLFLTLASTSLCIQNIDLHVNKALSGLT